MAVIVPLCSFMLRRNFQASFEWDSTEGATTLVMTSPDAWSHPAPAQRSLPLTMHAFFNAASLMSNRPVLASQFFLRMLGTKWDWRLASHSSEKVSISTAWSMYPLPNERYLRKKERKHLY